MGGLDGVACTLVNAVKAVESLDQLGLVLFVVVAGL